MNNPLLNQALIEMEQNLKNLESSRKQVDTVSEKTEDIIFNVQNLLSSVEKLKISYGTEEQSIKKVLQNGTENLKLSFDHSAKLLDDTSKNFNDTQIANLHNIQTAILEFERVLNAILLQIQELDLDKNLKLIEDTLKFQYDSIETIISNLSNIIEEFVNSNSVFFENIQQKADNHLKIVSDIKREVESHQIKHSEKMSDLTDLIKKDRSKVNDLIGDIKNEIDAFSKSSLTEIKEISKSIQKTENELKIKLSSIEDNISQLQNKHFNEISASIENQNDKIISLETTFDGLLKNLELKQESVLSQVKLVSDQIENNQKKSWLFFSIGLVVVILALIISQ